MKYACVLLVLFIASCQSKTSTEETSDSLAIQKAPPEDVYDSNKETSGATTEVTYNLLGPIDKYSIFIDPNTSLYEEPSLQSEIVTDLPEFTPALELQRTSIWEPEDEDICNRFLWYEVSLADGTKGWVPGKSIELKTSRDYTLAGKTVTINGKKYTLDFLEGAGIGPSDENGLTGCSTYTIPYFYNNEENTMHFVKVSSLQLQNAQRLFLTAYLNWLGLESSEGGDVSFQSFEVKGNNLIINAKAYYQDGGADGQITISVTNGIFELVSFYVEDGKDTYVDSIN